MININQLYNIASQLNHTPKPEIFKLDEEDEVVNEGGSKESSDIKEDINDDSDSKSDAHLKPEMSSETESMSHSVNGGRKRIRRKIRHRERRKHNKSSEQAKHYDESSLTEEAYDCTSEINMEKRQMEPVSPGKYFKDDPAVKKEIDEIPLSAFESSSSDSSDSSFESVYEKEGLKHAVEKGHDCIIEEQSDEEDNSPDKENNTNAGEDIMISLGDIPIEIDQGLDDKRFKGPHNMNADNGKAFGYPRKEPEVKLEDISYLDNESVSDMVPRQEYSFGSRKMMESLKSVNGNLQTLEKDMNLDGRLHSLEKQMLNSSKLFWYPFP